MSNHDDLFEPGLNSLLFGPEERVAALEEEVLRRGTLLREQEEALAGLRLALEEAGAETERVRRRFYTGIRWVSAGAGAALVLGLWEELCQVGWELFCTLTGAVGLPREMVMGAVTMAAAAFLVWKVGRWTLLTALKEMEEEEKA